MFFFQSKKKPLDFVWNGNDIMGAWVWNLVSEIWFVLHLIFIHSCMTAKKSCGKCFKEMTTVQMRTWHHVKIGWLWMVCFSWFKHGPFALNSENIPLRHLETHDFTTPVVKFWNVFILIITYPKNMEDIRNIYTLLWYFGTESRTILVSWH